jgi:hypothetical protein
MAAKRGPGKLLVALLVLGGLAGVAMASGLAWVVLSGRLSAADRSRIDAALAAAAARAADNDARWHAAMASRSGLAPGEDPCPVARPPVKGALAKRLGVDRGNGPDLDDWMRNVRQAQALMGESNEEIVAAAKLAEAKSPLRRMFEHKRDELTRAVSAQEEEPAKLVSRAEELAAPSFWTWDVVVIVDREILGGANVDKKTFEGGLAVGKAYVFDYREGRVTCAGDALATSSDVLHAATGLGQGTSIYGEIGRDLEAQLLESSKRELRAVSAPGAN